MKILLYTDLAIRPDQLFWHRDLGLLTKAFRDLGHEAYLVVHPATEPSAYPAVPNELDHPREQPCESLRESGKSPHRGASAQDGRGQVRGGQVPQLRDEVGPLPTFAPSHIPTSATSNIKRPTSKILDDPVLWPSSSDVRDPLWWKDHHPDLVILGLWTRPKFDTIRLAALASKVRLIERCDIDGFRLPSYSNWQCWKNTISAHKDALPHWPITIDTTESQN